MSNYHTMEINNKQDRVRVAFHIDVPDENNAVSFSLRTAIVQHLSPNSIVPFVEPAEQAQIQAGEVYEHVETVKFDAHLTVLEKRTIVDGRYVALATIIPDTIRARYRFWGLGRNVA